MSLAVFENFLKFAEGAVAAKADLPPSIDPAEFESALVSYGVVLLHSHMEQCLRSALEARCVRCVDAEVRAFALSIIDKETGKIGMDALKGTLGRFGAAYKNAFKDSLDKSGLGDSWLSIMSHRGTVAHQGQPATCSLADLRLFYDDIRQVLGFFCNGLGLISTEVAPISSLIIMPAAPTTAAAPAAPAPP